MIPSIITLQTKQPFSRCRSSKESSQDGVQVCKTRSCLLSVFVRCSFGLLGRGLLACLLYSHVDIYWEVRSERISGKDSPLGTRTHECAEELRGAFMPDAILAPSYGQQDQQSEHYTPGAAGGAADPFDACGQGRSRHTAARHGEPRPGRLNVDRHGHHNGGAPYHRQDPVDTGPRWLGRRAATRILRRTRGETPSRAFCT